MSGANQEVEVVQVIENREEHYYLKPDNPKYQFYRTEKIPLWLLEAYTKHRNFMLDYRKRIRQYFKPIKDKPMRIERYHVNENERHIFKDDGSVTVQRKEE